jgi:GT2 family glycosyltransferase
VLDNGENDNSAAVGAKFVRRLPLRYLVNPSNLGLGGSLNRGLSLCRGQRIVAMNDDALLPIDFLKACDRSFDADSSIGCLGFRPIEKGYHREGSGIGRIGRSGDVIANFDLELSSPMAVEHVYGFCYAVTRAALRKAGLFDHTLLARAYSSGNRIETDHCLSIRRAGFKVVFDPRIAVEHLAKPRLDMVERSLKWRTNDIRNTLYLFLKHFGLFGKSMLALRYALLHDLGIVSAVRRPSKSNWDYFLVGVKARLSAFGHYFLYQLQN